MQISVSEKYPQVYCLATQGGRNSVPCHGGFCGLIPPNKVL